MDLCFFKNAIQAWMHGFKNFFLVHFRFISFLFISSALIHRSRHPVVHVQGFSHPFPQKVGNVITIKHSIKRPHHHKLYKNPFEGWSRPWSDLHSRTCDECFNRWKRVWRSFFFFNLKYSQNWRIIRETTTFSCHSSSSLKGKIK